MIKTLMLTMMMFVCGAGMRVNGNEWVPYVNMVPSQSIPTVQVPVQVVPVYYYVAPQYVPVTVYQNVVVEYKQWCLLKKYEVVSVPRVMYVPVRY